MANDLLRRAMSDATMTEAALAAAVGVDAKTVARWIADETRVPHPRHRWATCEALGVGEDVLWPDAIKHTVKTGPDREVMAVYPFRSSCPKSVWQGLITGAQREVTFCAYTAYFLWLEIPNLRNVLRKKAERGTRIRFLIGDPESEITRRREEVEAVPLTVSTRIRITLDELAKLRETSGIETRYSDDHVSMSVFVFDNEALVTPHLGNLVGHDSPMLHLRRMQEDGLYDRFRFHADALWSAGREVWPD